MEDSMRFVKGIAISGLLLSLVGSASADPCPTGTNVCAASHTCTCTPNSPVSAVGHFAFTVYGTTFAIPYFKWAGMPASCGMSSLFGYRMIVGGNAFPDNVTQTRLMGQAMSSELSGKKITRVDFTQNSDTTCYVSLIEY
jgi:hypothetical protein